MEVNPYYGGLSQNELSHGTPFIVPIEALWYCKSLDKKDIRYGRLKEISNDSLCEKTNGERTDFGGNYDKIIKRYEREGLLRVKKVGKKDTRIRPNIPLIEKELRREQIENLSSNKNFYRILKPGDMLNRARAPPIQSVSISDGVSITVTHANPKRSQAT